ncbi:MAG: GNAT family N-acetyltransferase [Deltaproteobacteria bacterium]|nr:MAG: GNAT family N-acetyltransferase [Deltaproteobacteria bacterium]TNF29090.1 MAG: GNAT family N-acetyltransferase [Deltaproteobacteria bacterium]
MNYTNDVSVLDKLDLNGFFVGWPNPPSNSVFKKMLKQSYKVFLAYENEKLIGFVNCISDGVLSAYIPLLEVLPEYQGQGIGQELVRKIQQDINHLYMVDLLCDEDLIPFYEKLGMMRATGALLRNYDRQNGE